MNPRHLAFATLGRLHQNDLLAGVAKYREHALSRNRKPRPVFGIYNQNDYLVQWIVCTRRHAEKQADKLRWDDAKITVRLVP